MQSIGEVTDRRLLSQSPDHSPDDNLPPTQEGLCWIHHPFLASGVRSFFTSILVVLNPRL